MTTDVLQEPEVCFICLESEAAGPLHSPCACPRKVHPYCLARWQLQCAGKEEEKHCRFCKHNLPCWKDAFANDDVTDAVPVMSIHFNNSTYWLKVHQGQEGLARFKADIRQLLGLAEHMHFDITFECKVPGADGGRMELRGLDAFDAAVYCASLTAAERRKARRRSSSRDKHSPTSTSSHSNSSGSSSSSSVASAGDGEADSDPTTPLGLAQSRGRGPAGEAPDIDWMTNNSRSNRSRDSWASGTGGGSAAGGVAAGTTGSGARRGGRRSSNGSSSGSDAGGGGEPGRLGWKQLSKLFAFLKKQPSSSSRTSISSRSGSTMSESYSVDAFSSSGRRTGRISSSNSIASVASSADGVTQVVTPGATPLVRRAGGGDLPLLTAKAKQLLPGRLLKRLRAALVRALP